MGLVFVFNVLFQKMTFIEFILFKSNIKKWKWK